MTTTSTDDGSEVDTKLGRGIVGGQRLGCGATDGCEGLAIIGGIPYPDHGWNWVPVCTADEAEHGT